MQRAATSQPYPAQSGSNAGAAAAGGGAPSRSSSSNDDDSASGDERDGAGGIGMGRRAHTEGGIGSLTRGLSNYSGDLPPGDDAPTGQRAALLRQELSPAQQRVFRMSLQDWLTCDRAATGAWRCSVARPVAVSDLRPIDVSFVRSDDAARAVLEKRFYVFDGPVTALATDAIVNAANEGCMGGGGVDGVVHSAAGGLLLRECATFRGCATGEARITKGYNLPARAILHTAGPIGERPRELTSCYRSTLAVARRFGLRSVGYCCISTGIFGYPLAKATRIAIETTVRSVLEEADGEDSIEAIVFACFRPEEGDAYRKLFQPVVLDVLKSRQQRTSSGEEEPAARQSSSGCC